MFNDIEKTRVILNQRSIQRKQLLIRARKYKVSKLFEIPSKIPSCYLLKHFYLLFCEEEKKTKKYKKILMNIIRTNDRINAKYKSTSR